MRRLIKSQEFLGFILISFLSFLFFWKFFLKGLIPVPADLIVGIYYPWRDYIWNNFTAGVPFKNGLLSDVVSIIYPWRIYGIELLKNGVWPLWIPHALSGTPLLANFQSGLFYPLNLLFFVFSNINAWSIYIIIQPIMAGFFTFLFLKNLKLNFLPSLIGGFIFAFCGFMLVWLEYGIVGHAGLWLPLVLLTIDKLSNKPSSLWVVIGAFTVGFSLLAGYPQIAVFSLAVAVLYLLFKIFWIKEKVDSRGFLLILGFFFLGILLAAVQLLPGLELWRFSIRGADPTAAAFNFGLNPLKNLILFWAPDFYGNPATGNFWGNQPYNESALYVGIGGLFLVAFTLFSFTKDKALSFFKILLILSLLMAFLNPISSFIFNSRLPLLASSSAGRFLFLVDFSLAILAAFGAQLLLKQKKIKLPLIALAVVVVPFLIVFGFVFLSPGSWPDKDLLENLAVAKRNLILPTLLMTPSVLLFLSLFLKRLLKFRKGILSLLFLFIIFDLFRFGFKYTPFTNREYLYPETDLTTFLKEQEGLYRFYGLIPQSMFIPYNLFSLEGYEPLMIKWYGEFANQINEEKFQTVSTGSRWVIVNRHESSLLNLMGVKYLLSHNAEPVSNWDAQYFRYSEKKYKLVFQYGKSQVYENKEVLPRAFIVHDFQVLPEEEILRTLTNKSFDPTETLLLEKKPIKLPETKKGEDKVFINENTYFKNEVLIKTNADADGFLFLSDNFYPGWEAFVDGEKTEIYRVDYTFRAIFLLKGEHMVKFLFRPQSFKIGLGISIGTLLVLIVLLSYEVARRRHPSQKSSS